MVVSLDPRGTHALTVGDIAGLWAYLQQVVGQPFRFLRASYADELTLHLGAELPPASAKLKKPRGSYVLTFRGSAWVLRSGAGPILFADPFSFSKSADWQPITLEQLEQTPPITPGAVVVWAVAFQDNITPGFGFLMGFSDGGFVQLRPTPAESEGKGTEEGEDLPPVADWELFTPYGRYLRVGPGLKWAYEPSGREEGAARKGAGAQAPEADTRPAG
jgi:hypothetical protein